MDRLDKVVEEMGIYNASIDIEKFLLYKEMLYKDRMKKQEEETLAEQQALRYRWRGE